MEPDPCPCCSGPAVWTRDPKNFGFMGIECGGCGLRTPYYQTKKAAALAWNTRTDYLITQKRAAAMLDLTPETLANWRKRGWGPDWVQFHGHVRYFVEDILRWVRKHRQFAREVEDKRLRSLEEKKAAKAKTKKQKKAED